MRKVVMAFLSILLAFTCLSAHAQFKSYGIGDMSCAQYLRETPESEQESSPYNWWLAGFISGSNASKGRVTYTDNQAHFSWVRQHCEKNPLDTFVSAALALDIELNKRTSK